MELPKSGLKDHLLTVPEWSSISLLGSPKGDFLQEQQRVSMMK